MTKRKKQFNWQQQISVIGAHHIGKEKLTIPYRLGILFLPLSVWSSGEVFFLSKTAARSRWSLGALGDRCGDQSNLARNALANRHTRLYRMCRITLLIRA